MSQDIITLSAASNPLTAPLAKKAGQSPVERAIERFAITGNAIGKQYRSSSGSTCIIYYANLTFCWSTVTGGAGGLGLEAARALLEHGAKGLCIFDLSSAFEASRAVLQALYDEFPTKTIVEEIVDVTNEQNIQSAVEKTVKNFGSVDILLCFAGIARMAKAEDMTLETWQQVLDINLTGSWLCSKAIGKEMIKQGTGGSIVLVSSIAGHRALFPTFTSAYSVSKAGILGLTKNLAGEWARYGIRVNCICPGFIETPMTGTPQGSLGYTAFIERNPMGRMGQPSELTGPVVMFCSPAGRYITGTTL
ncbi:hypothetical protein BDZ97DRAFT_812970 [Flammula alnicola]|nr:hypothetical protein BDZ97DRAFT_812970 [Flammula alnicola]